MTVFMIRSAAAWLMALAADFLAGVAVGKLLAWCWE